MLRGEDAQLIGATRHLLKQLDSKKEQWWNHRFPVRCMWWPSPQALHAIWPAAIAIISTNSVFIIPTTRVIICRTKCWICLWNVILKRRQRVRSCSRGMAGKLCCVRCLFIKKRWSCRKSMAEGAVCLTAFKPTAPCSLKSGVGFCAKTDGL